MLYEKNFTLNFLFLQISCRWADAGFLLFKSSRLAFVWALSFAFGMIAATAYANTYELRVGEPLGAALNILEDPSHGVDISALMYETDDDLWQPLKYDSLNLGFTKSTVWLKFEVPYTSNSEPRLLEIANNKVTHVSVYLVERQGSKNTIINTYVSGTVLPVEERIIQHRNFVFPIAFPTVEPSKDLVRTVYIQVRNEYPMKLPIYWWDENAFQKNEAKRLLFNGFYFGAVTILVLYNLFIYLIVKDKSYATYVLFMVFFSIVILIDNGFGYEYIWTHEPELNFHMYLFFIAVGAGTTVRFTSEFLSLKENHPPYFTGLNYLFVAWMVVALASIFWPSIWVLFLEMLILIPGGIALFLAGLLMWKKGVPAAPFYTIAWFIIIAGVVAYALNLLGVIPISAPTEYALQVSNIIEGTLLSIGLAYRIKSLSEERQAAYAMTAAKSDFLATMSHEIRTPMNGILGMAQLLNDTELSKKQDNYIKTILGSGQALLTVLNDILDYSKIEAGKLEIESVSYNVRRLVDETAAMFALKAAEKNLYYNVIVAPGVPIKIKGDPTRVRQIITNFLSNAFKFTEEGKILLVLERDEASNSLKFEVRDTGIGIPPNKIDHVFEEFTQADSSTARHYGGTGLGLPISKRLVAIMGGKIGVRSEVSKGSVFWFSLPIQDEVAFSYLANPEAALEVSKMRILQISPAQEFNDQNRQYSNVWGFGLLVEPTIHSAIASLPKSTKPFSLISVDQLCEDFSLQAIRDELLVQPWAEGAQLILEVSAGTQIKGLENLSLPPWIAEYPVSITQLQLLILEKVSGKPKSEAASSTATNYSGKDILVVEDNPVNSKVVGAFLKKMGASATVVESGEYALERVCQHKQVFDLILMDCEMPGIDGYTTAARIRLWEQEHGRSPHTILALSAHAMESHKARCMDAGMDGFIPKPIIYKDLQAVLARYLLS